MLWWSFSATVTFVQVYSGSLLCIQVKLCFYDKELEPVEFLICYSNLSNGLLLLLCCVPIVLQKCVLFAINNFYVNMGSGLVTKEIGKPYGFMIAFSNYIFMVHIALWVSGITS